MQSDRHRVIPLEQAPTDNAGELELPDELAELADQLQRDAAHLAVCYPGPGKRVGDRTMGHGHRQGRRLRWLVAGGVAACVLLSFAVARWNGNPAAPIHSPVRTNATNTPAAGSTNQLAQNPSPFAESSAALFDNAEHATSDLPSEEADTVVPVMFLRNVSGPELEALLDMWDSDSSPGSNISI